MIRARHLGRYSPSTDEIEDPIHIKRRPSTTKAPSRTKFPSVSHVFTQGNVVQKAASDLIMSVPLELRSLMQSI